MDGRLAILFLVLNGVDMGLNSCDGGCFTRAPDTARFTFATGNVLSRGRTVGKEAYVTYEQPYLLGTIKPSFGASLSTTGDLWFGYGAVYTKTFAQDSLFIQSQFLPGIYVQGAGKNLGHPIEFRSSIELGYQNTKGMRLGLSYDHRSNGSIALRNPGVETLQIRLSIPL